MRRRYRDAERMQAYAAALPSGCSSARRARSRRGAASAETRPSPRGDPISREEGAELLLKRAIAIDEKVHGPDHPGLATSLNKLATLYQATGRYAQAEPLFQRAIAIGEKTLGPEHPDLAGRLNNLAVLYWATGRPAAAEPLFVRALAILEARLPPGHPALAAVRENYAGFLDALGRHEEAATARGRRPQLAGLFSSNKGLIMR